MKFGPIPVETAEGAVLAHATTAGEKRCAPLTYFDTVAVDTLAAAATSRMVGIFFFMKEVSA